MTYEEAIEATITRTEALCELHKHHADVWEFFAELGDHDTYSGADVLAWLGY
jgi:hypothetical protein